MKLARMFLAAVAVASIVQPATAQFDANGKISTDRLYVVSGGDFSPYGRYAGMFMATPGQPIMDILCIDFLNGVEVDEQFAVNITRLDAGAAAFDARTRFGSAQQDNYMKAAYLSNFFAGLTDPSRVQDLSYAVWRLFTPAAPSPGRPGESDWTALLADNAWRNIDLTQYFVLSDQTMVITNSRDGRIVTGGRQEFLTTVVPEPGSVLMLSTGLLSLVGLARFRRRRNSA